MIILICGLSASGKSHLVEYIAKKYNYKYVHTSDILKQFSNNIPESKISIDKTEKNKGWYEFSNLDNRRKNNINLDKKLDRFLCKLVKEKDNLVLDSWTLPYLVKNNKNIIKIWLDGTKKERAKRLSLRNNVSYSAAYNLLKKKDNFSINHFKKLYGFTLGKDKEVFDFILDTTPLNLKEVEREAISFLKNKF